MEGIIRFRIGTLVAWRVLTSSIVCSVASRMTDALGIEHSVLWFEEYDRDQKPFKQGSVASIKTKNSSSKF